MGAQQLALFTTPQGTVTPLPSLTPGNGDGNKKVYGGQLRLYASCSPTVLLRNSWVKCVRQEVKAKDFHHDLEARLVRQY